MQSSLSTFIWLVCPLAALGIGIVSPQLREAIQAFCEQISALIEGLYEFAKNGLKNTVGWMLTLSERPKPFPSLFGLIILAIAVLDTSFAEFRVASKTIGVIFPWSEEAPMLAFALVGLTAATGILAHLANGGLRKAAFLLAILLVITQGFLAYLRASESLPLVGKNDAFDIDEGGLIIEGINGQFNDFPTQETTVTPNPPSIFNPTVLLTTVAAVLFSMAAVVTFWGGTVLAGSFVTWMVCWILGGVGLAICFVPTVILFLLHLIVDQGRLTKVLLAIAEAIFTICRLPLKGIEWLRSFRQRKWEQEQERMTYNDRVAYTRTRALHDRAVAEHQRAHELTMQQLEHKYQLSHLETIVESSNLHKEACLDIHRETLSLMRTIATSAASRIETEFGERLRDRVQPQIADVTEALIDYTLLPIKMTQHVSQVHDLLTAAIHGSGNHNSKQMKGVKDESTIRDSEVDARPSAD